MSITTVPCEPPAERPDGVWNYVSPSRLNLWLKCPLAFRLHYLDREPSPPSVSQFVGRMVHRGLETYYRHRQLGLSIGNESLAGWLDLDWGPAASEDGVQFDNRVHERGCQQQVSDLVAAYLARVPSDEPRPLAVEVTVEAPLVNRATGEDLGIPLLGIVDLVLPEADGPLIVDFKTTARGEPLEIMHEIQLSSYSYLFRQASPEPEAALEIRNLVKTKTPKIEAHRYTARTAGHFGRLFAVIRAYLDDLERGRFVYRPGLGCGMCEFRRGPCRAWQG